MNPTECGAGTSASLDSVCNARRFAVALAVLLVTCFAPVMFGMQTFVARDFSLFGYPLAFYHRQSIWNGEIPLWNPLSSCGLPFVAQWNTMVFYPPSLFYVLLPLPWSLCLFCLLHLYFGALGMFFLARAWTGSSFAATFAGTVFAFNGLTLHCLMWPNNSAALAWSPWVLLFMQRAWRSGGWTLVPAIIAGVFQFLAGAPEAFLFTWIVAAGIWISDLAGGAETNQYPLRQEGFLWKSLVRFSAVVVAIVVMAAVQLLPLIQLAGHSQRSSSYDTGGWAMPPTGWANLLLPLFHTITSPAGLTFQIGQAWTSSYYFGAITVALAIWSLLRCPSRRTFVLALLVIGALVLALGNAGYVWPLLKNNVGALGMMRYPVKLVFLLACPLILLASVGLASLLRDHAQGRPFPRLAYVVPGVMLVLMLLLIWVDAAHADPRENVPKFIVNSLCRAGFLLAIFSAVIVALRSSGRGAVYAGVLSLALVAADLLSHMRWQNPTASSEVLAPAAPALNQLRAALPPGSGRLMASLSAIEWFHQIPATNVAEVCMAARLGVSHNLNLLEGVPKADGFFSLYLASEQEVEHRIFRDEDNMQPAVADAMAVAVTTAQRKLFDWTRRTNALPLVSIGQEPVFVPERGMIDAMLTNTFEPHATVLLPVELKGVVPALRQPNAHVTLQLFKPHLIKASIDAPGPALVVIAQAYYPAWKSYVDGVSVPLLRANHAFQAVQVPAGKHQLELRYEDTRFRVGAAISGISALLVLIVVALRPACRRTFTEVFTNPCAL